MEVERDQDGNAKDDVLTLMGSLRRTSAQRVSRVRFSPDGQHLVVQSASKVLEAFQRRSRKDTQAHIKRRQKRAEKKANKRKETGENQTPEETAELNAELLISDEYAPFEVRNVPQSTHEEEEEEEEVRFFKGKDGGMTIQFFTDLFRKTLRKKENSQNIYDLTARPTCVALASVLLLRCTLSLAFSLSLNSALTVSLFSLLVFFGLQTVRLRAKTKSFSFQPSKRRDVGSATLNAVVAVALTDNSIELHELKGGVDNGSGQMVETSGTSSRINGIELPGHRSDVRSVALASDDSLMVSTSSAGAKVWNPRTGVCLRTNDQVGYGLSSCFIPGNRHVVIGTKEGHLEIMDVVSGDVIQQLEAHTGAVWSINLLPDNSGLVSGSADKDVKFWTFTAITDQLGARKLSLELQKTLRMTEDVLCAKCR